MVAERPRTSLPYEIFDFYTDGKRIRTSYIEQFRRELNSLLVREREERPLRPGTFLLLERDASFGRLQTLLRISDRLVRNGFKDCMNWGLGDKNDPVYWWTDRVALDVVGLPAYSDKEGRHFLVGKYSWSYRLFTRPSYLRPESANK